MAQTQAKPVGQLRHYITLETKAVGSADDYGQRTLTWTELASVWAALEVKSASETVAGDRKVHVAKYIFVVRYNALFNSALRLLYRGAYYSINAVYDKDGLGKHLTIEASLDASNNSAVV